MGICMRMDEMSQRVKTIICLEGSHGCGKTALLQEIASRGGNVIDEGFLDMPQLGLGPQTHTMEMVWVAKWVEKVLALPPGVYFADRGLYSAVLYAMNGRDMQLSLLHIHDEIAHVCNVINVYIRVDEDTLWRRITERLKHEPFREKYNEHKREQMVRARAFYEYNHALFKHTVDNGDGEWSQCIGELCKIGCLDHEAP